FWIDTSASLSKDSSRYLPTCFSDSGECSDDEKISVRSGSCRISVAVAGDARGNVRGATGGWAAGRGNRAVDSCGEHRARTEEDYRFAEVAGRLAGTGQYPGGRKAPGGVRTRDRAHCGCGV